MTESKRMIVVVGNVKWMTRAWCCKEGSSKVGLGRRRET